MSQLINAFEPLFRLQNEMNRLFEDFVQEVPTSRPYGAMYPAVTLWEDGDNAYLECELPGLTLTDVEVYAIGNELTVRGQRNKMPEVPDASYHRRERPYGQFSRTITLPWEIQTDKVEAKLVDGVLTIKLPKSEAAKPHKVKLLGA